MKALRVVIDLDKRPARADVANILREIAEMIDGGTWEATRTYGWWNVRHVSDPKPTAADR